MCTGKSWIRSGFVIIVIDQWVTSCYGLCADIIPWSHKHDLNFHQQLILFYKWYLLLYLTDISRFKCIHIFKLIHSSLNIECWALAYTHWTVNIRWRTSVFFASTSLCICITCSSPVGRNNFRADSVHNLLPHIGSRPQNFEEWVIHKSIHSSFLHK